jgi:hypothetical protein
MCYVIVDFVSMPQLFITLPWFTYYDAFQIELTFIEINQTFDSIMPFPCFFDVARNVKVIFNN